MSDESNNNNFWLGFFLASSVTTVATIIFHPRNAVKTRKILRKTSQALPQIANDFFSTLQTHSQNISSSAAGKWQRNLHRLQVAVKAGIEASKANSQR